MVKQRGFNESASLTAGTEASLTGTVVVPENVSRIVAVAFQSQGGGIIKMEGESIGSKETFPLADPMGTVADYSPLTIIPTNISVSPKDTLSFKRTASVTTSSKYETVWIQFA